MLQALWTIWFRFLQKKSKKKFHACVPLITRIKLFVSGKGRERKRERVGADTGKVLRYRFCSVNAQQVSKFSS